MILVEYLVRIKSYSMGLLTTHILKITRSTVFAPVEALFRTVEKTKKIQPEVELLPVLYKIYAQTGAKTC